MSKTVKNMKTILIADEDSAVRKFVSALFSDIGYKVVSASDGMDAISKAKKVKPDMVIADVSLSDRDGYEVSEKIKDDPVLEDASVILLISSLGTFDEARAAEVRADDFMIKPLKSEEVIKKVESLISQHEKKGIELAFNLIPHIEEAMEGSGEFKMFEDTMREEKPETYELYGRAKYNNGAEEIKIERGALESDEEIVLLEEEFIESEPDVQSDGKKTKTLDEKSRAEIVDKVSEILMKRLSEIIPESISKVVDSVLKEEIKKIKED